MDPAAKHAITTIKESAWAPIQYTNAVFDEAARAWVSVAEVAEAEFTAFSSRKKDERIAGRLMVRCIPALNLKASDGQPALFDTHRRDTGQMVLLQNQDGYDSGQAHQRPRLYCFQRPKNTAPPTQILALENSLAKPLRCHARATPSSMQPVNTGTKRGTPTEARLNASPCPKSQNHKSKRIFESARTRTGPMDSGLVHVPGIGLERGLDGLLEVGDVV